MYVMKDLANWTGCPRPGRKILEGRYVRLEPLDAQQHGDGLYEISHGKSGEQQFKYLWETIESRERFQNWLVNMEKATDPVMFVLIDKDTGNVEGRQSLWNIDEANGVVEIGHVLRTPSFEGKPGSLEAIFLFQEYIFEQLGYRRMAVRTHHKNYRSLKAIHRYGLQFEGVMRQHGVKKGKNQDSCFFSILDAEWPFQKRVLQIYLKPENFDERGKCKRRLDEVRTEIMFKSALKMDEEFV